MLSDKGAIATTRHITPSHIAPCPYLITTPQPPLTAALFLLEGNGSDTGEMILGATVGNVLVCPMNEFIVYHGKQVETCYASPTC